MCFVLLSCLDLSAQNRQSDREFQGLKGKVKSVLTERADANMKGRKLIESKRRKQQSISFHPDGSASTNEDFAWDSGDLRELNKYFKVDGDKALTSTFGPGAIFIIATPPDKPSKPRDPRYQFKLKYKHDDRGRITEESWLQNDGDLWLRYVYEYAAGERRELVYDADGALNQRYIYKLDAKGNEIEMISYDVATGEIEGKEKYEYLRFDRQGNWSKRIEYEANSDSKFKFRVREVKYRTFTYYP